MGRSLAVMTVGDKRYFGVYYTVTDCLMRHITTEETFWKIIGKTQPPYCLGDFFDYIDSMIDDTSDLINKGDIIEVAITCVDYGNGLCFNSKVNTTALKVVEGYEPGDYLFKDDEDPNYDWLKYEGGVDEEDYYNKLFKPLYRDIELHTHGIYTPTEIIKGGNISRDENVVTREKDGRYLSDRNDVKIPLVTNTPFVLQVEDWCKWYELYYLHPASLDDNTMKLSSIYWGDVLTGCDHYYYPYSVVEFVKLNHMKLDATSYVAICLRYIEDGQPKGDIIEQDMLPTLEDLLSVIVFCEGWCNEYLITPNASVMPDYFLRRLVTYSQTPEINEHDLLQDLLRKCVSQIKDYYTNPKMREMKLIFARCTQSSYADYTVGGFYYLDSEYGLGNNTTYFPDSSNPGFHGILEKYSISELSDGDIIGFGKCEFEVFII